jgi:phage gpG-like protein
MNNFRNQFRRAANEVRRFITGKLPGTIGKMTQEHFQASFDNEGFTDATLKKWPEVKRRQGTGGKQYSRKRRTDKILHDTGELHKSIRWDDDFDGKIVIKSDLDYSQIHNEGGMAGRGHKVRIPQRQFMGPSKAVNKKIEKEIIRGIDIIFKYK